MKTNIIEVKNVSKTYGTKVLTHVLKDVSLQIEKGSLIWLIGSSGSGKTTLLNLISGLDDVTTGTILINNKDITHMTEKQKAHFRANNLGFVFQFHYLIPEFKALENVLIPLEIQGKKITPEIKDQALDLMDKMGIKHVADHYPKEMSGGEQQRTAIARAIISKPDIVIADEPTGNLDSKTADAVYEIIRTLHKEYKVTFLIVTHDEFTPLKGDRVLKIHDGKIVEDMTY